jgi:hypothetical protein
MLGMAGGFETLLWLGIVGGIVFVTAFWIWMLVDCATMEPNQGTERIAWILVILLTHWIGAVIYFFVRRPQRVQEVGQ